MKTNIVLCLCSFFGLRKADAARRGVMMLNILILKSLTYLLLRQISFLFLPGFEI